MGAVVGLGSPFIHEEASLCSWISYLFRQNVQNQVHILVEPQRPECWRKTGAEGMREKQERGEEGEKKKRIQTAEIQIYNLLLVKRTG